jgi:hypothetical protein
VAHCSWASSVLCWCLTAQARASPASSCTLPGADHATIAWPVLSSPGSRARSVHACWGSQTAQSPSSTCGGVLLSVAFRSPTSVGALDKQLSRRHGPPTCPPTDFSSASSRRPPHGSGPGWFARPSLQWTYTIYSLPVSRQIWAKCHNGNKGSGHFRAHPEHSIRHEESMWSPQAESPRIGMPHTVGAAHRLGLH